MRRHVIGVRRGRSDLGVDARCSQTLFGEHGIVVAVDQVMRDARMVWLLGQNRLQDFAALALVGKGSICLGSGNGEAERVEDGGLTVASIARLDLTHLPLKGLG